MGTTRALMTHISELASRIRLAVLGHDDRREWFSYVGQFGDDFFGTDD